MRDLFAIVESVLMLFTENYQNWSVLVETIYLAKVGAFFETMYNPTAKGVRY